MSGPSRPSDDSPADDDPSVPDDSPLADDGVTVVDDPTPAGGDPPAVDPEVATALRRLRSVSHLLDDSIRIPWTTRRVGVEPLIGLLPVAGDAFGLACSTYVAAVAVRTGVPRATLARVALILWLDAAVGSIPLLGDLFDAYWKANLRSTRLLEARLADPESAAADRRYLWRAGVAVLLLGAAAVAAVAALGWWLAGVLW